MAKSAPVITGLSLAALLFTYVLTTAFARGVEWLPDLDLPLAQASPERVVRLQKELNQTRHALVSAEGELAEQSQALAALGLEYQALQGAHVQEVERLVSAQEQARLEDALRHAEAMQELTAQHEYSVLQLEQTYRAEVAALQAIHSDEVARLKSTHNQTLDATHQALNTVERQLNQARGDLEHARAQLASARAEVGALSSALDLSRQVRPAGLFATAERMHGEDGRWTFGGAYNTIRVEPGQVGWVNQGHLVVYLEQAPGLFTPQTLSFQITDPAGHSVGQGAQSILLDPGGHVVFPYQLQLKATGTYTFTTYLNGQETASLRLYVTN